jgi:paraquat-inducible protein B
MHKGDLDDLDDLSDLAIKSKAINKAAQATIQPKINNKIVLGSQKVSTLTIVTPENPQKPLLDAVFKNDTQDMPQKLTKLLKEMLCELESNFNKLTARKRLNDQIFNLVSQTVKEDQKVSYNPKRKKENIQGNLIYNEDC